MAVVPKCVRRFALFGLLPLLVVGGVVGWFERQELLCCYYLHQLKQTRGESASAWAEKLAGLDEPPVEDVLALLTDADEGLCANARGVLAALGRKWGPGDPRVGELMCLTLKSFPRMSEPGRHAVLTLSAEWLSESPTCPDCVTGACGRLIADVTHAPVPSLLAPAVELAVAGVARSGDPNLLCPARDLARHALTSGDPTTRVRALKLAAQPGVDLKKEAVPLLHDREPLVRRAAMLAVGGCPEVIDTDTLLGWLHDPDAEVRQLCERALRSEERGLKPEYIRVALLVTDPRWEVRLRVLDVLQEDEELAGDVLRRLSHDPSLAVRAAAVRAAAENESVDLTDRLEQMSREDPSVTVSRLARYYLRQRRTSRQPRFD